MPRRTKSLAKALAGRPLLGFVSPTAADVTRSTLAKTGATKSGNVKLGIVKQG